MNTVERLKSGDVVEVDGVMLRKQDSPLCSGDFYVGERNTGPHLLEVKKVVFCDPPLDTFINFVVATDLFAYSYDGGDVVKVEECV
jgi:hypothetical protein